MNPGSQAIVTIVLKAAAAGLVTETASVSSDSLDPNPSDSTSSVTTTVNPASDLAVGIAADNDVAALGVPLNYTLTVTNNGPSDASGVVLTDGLPAGATFLGATDSQGNAAGTVDSGSLSWAIGELASGDSASLVIAVHPTAAAGRDPGRHGLGGRGSRPTRTRRTTRRRSPSRCAA